MRALIRVSGLIHLALLPLAAACTSFATVRSAEVFPGVAVSAQASKTTTLADIPNWFWSYSCSEGCDHPVVGGDAGVTYGWPHREGGAALAVSLGVSGVYPYGPVSSVFGAASIGVTFHGARYPERASDPDR